MPDAVPLAELVSIRDAGFDEYWLQDQIVENPAALRLGDLDAIATEKQQSSGGRLDILLKNQEDDSMYEVEVMLGETDESHIIRTIEYWDNEKRKWPQRQHVAVLVAEHINRRFFNVIHLLSYSIPIVAIQASLLVLNGTKSLFFTKILDTYEEIEDTDPSLDDRKYTRDDWAKKAKWTLETADTLLKMTETTLDQPTLNYVKAYIAITVGNNNYMWLQKRTQPKSLLAFRMTPLLQDEVAALLDSKNISYIRKPKSFRIIVDKDMVEQNSELITSLAHFIKKSWTS
jgi:hypothetical protein